MAHRCKIVHVCISLTVSHLLSITLFLHIRHASLVKNSCLFNSLGFPITYLASRWLRARRAAGFCPFRGALSPLASCDSCRRCLSACHIKKERRDQLIRPSNCTSTVMYQKDFERIKLTAIVVFWARTAEDS
jgi:hypothetical protein